MLRCKTSGLSVLELITVLVITGVLAVVSVPAYRAYKINAKIAESYVMINALNKSEKMYFLENKTFMNTSPNPTVPPTKDYAPSHKFIATAHNQALGNPLPVGSNAYFSYYATIGRNNADGAFADAAGAPMGGYLVAIHPMLDVPYLTGKPLSNCMPSTPVSDLYGYPDRTPNRHYALLVASANFHDVNLPEDSCTLTLQVVIHVNGEFKETSFVSIRENLNQSSALGSATSSTGGSSSSSATSSSSSSSTSSSGGSSLSSGTDGDTKGADSTKDSSGKDTKDSSGEDTKGSDGEDSKGEAGK